MSAIIIAKHYYTEEISEKKKQEIFEKNEKMYGSHGSIATYIIEHANRNDVDITTIPSSMLKD